MLNQLVEVNNNVLFAPMLTANQQSLSRSSHFDQTNQIESCRSKRFLTRIVAFVGVFILHMAKDWAKLAVLFRFICLLNRIKLSPIFMNKQHHKKSLMCFPFWPASRSNAYGNHHVLYTLTLCMQFYSPLLAQQYMYAKLVSLISKSYISEVSKCEIKSNLVNQHWCWLVPLVDYNSET